MKGDQAGWSCWEPWDWDYYPPGLVHQEYEGEVDHKVTGNEIAGSKVTADGDRVEPPPNRRAAVERLVEAGERLKKTLAEPRDVPFPSTIRDFLQTLLDVLTGDAAEDFQELQDSSLRFYWFSHKSRDDRRLKKFCVASAFEKALKHPGIAPHIDDAMKLLLEVKDKLFHPPICGPLSTVVFGNLLHVIREELQGAEMEAQKEKNAQSLGRRLNEDACQDLASLLQKTVEFLKLRENRSREVVKKVDEADRVCWNTGHWDLYPTIRIFNWSGLEMRDKDSEGLPSSRTAAVRRLVEAGERLKKTLARHKRSKSRAPSIPFLSTLKPYLQALLELLTGEIEEDFQKLQDRFHGVPCFDKKRYMKSRIAMAFEEAMRNPETSPHLQKAVNLLLEVKDKLFPSSYWDTRSTLLFGNLLQVISEELQTEQIRTEKEKNSQSSEWRWDEDACQDLAPLLQKTVEFLEARENRSREKVNKVDEGDSSSWECWHWGWRHSSKIFDMRMKAKQQEEAGEKLKRTLAGWKKCRPGTADFHFPSTVRPYIQALLEVLTGDAMEDFQKLQDASHNFYYLFTSSLDKRRHRRRKVAAAFKEAMEHAETSSHIGEAVKLLPEVKKKLLHPFERGRQSAKVIGNKLQVISKKLHKAEAEKKDSQALGWRLDEDACMELVSLLQQTVELLEDWENQSREDVTQVDEEDPNCSQSLDQHQDSLRRIFDGLEERIERRKEDVTQVDEEDPNCSQSLDQHQEESDVHYCPNMVFGPARLLRTCLLLSSLKAHLSLGRAWKGVVTSTTLKLLVLLLLASLLGGVTASPLSATPQVQGGGRAEQGGHKVIPKPSLGSMSLPVLHQPFELLCIVFGLPQNHDIHLTYTWFKDSREIPDQTGKSVVFPSLTREDEGVYMCRARSGHVLTTSPDSNEKDLRILIPPRVHMEPATPDNVIRRAAGGELTLICKVTEAIPWVPADGYSWSYLPSKQGLIRHLSARKSTLRLGSLTREDSGQYFCQARNDLEAFQGLLPPGNTSVTVDVLYMQQIVSTPDLEVNEGDRLTLTCRVDSNTLVHLSWLVDGQEVRHVTANTDHYVLQRAACSDSKTYTCRASSADLPGLESHVSTKVRVVCNNNETSLTSPSPSFFTKSNEGTVSTPTPLFGLLGLLLVPLIITGILIILCCYKHKHLWLLSKEKLEWKLPTSCKGSRRQQSKDQGRDQQGMNESQAASREERELLPPPQSEDRSEV